VEFHAGTDEVPMAARRGLYRVVQEALTNIARHARATAVRVRLDCLPERIELAIADDGVGIPPGTIANPRSLGLVGMRERAAALGADFRIEGGPGQGTTVRIILPRPEGSVE
jgi:signal transduction histidine kinase